MRIIREINRGGFGIVEEVELDNNTLAARKVFSPSVHIHDPAELEKTKRRFIREAKTQAAIGLRGTFPIFSVDIISDPPSYLMPMAARTLQDEIIAMGSGGAIPVSALADILNALDELHELGYVHRDLKPGNVLLHDDIWKLGDFGLVLPPDGQTTILTSVNSAWGSHQYCAPEQVHSFHTVTNAADIYSFGCILHDIFGTSPRVPFHRHTAPGDIGAVIEKCTEIQPERRFKSVSALRGALLPLLVAGPATTPSPSATDWIDDLKAGGWNAEKIATFNRYIHTTATSADIYSIFSQIDEDDITMLAPLDNGAFLSIANRYCNWVYDGGFNWDYCDILIRRLEKIFEISSTEIKAEAVISAARMARSHNRWFVMGRVINMCGHSMHDVLARRVAIEIRARDAKDDFLLCASRILNDKSVYHAHIQSALT